SVSPRDSTSPVTVNPAPPTTLPVSPGARNSDGVSRHASAPAGGTFPPTSARPPDTSRPPSSRSGVGFDSMGLSYRTEGRRIIVRRTPLAMLARIALGAVGCDGSAHGALLETGPTPPPLRLPAVTCTRYA